ncbi:MAG: alpha-xylosidase, partial [Bacteroidales bacterium]|nr:alpha-xylosidase [Bacteroidales bacterium]
MRRKNIPAYALAAMAMAVATPAVAQPSTQPGVTPVELNAVQITKAQKINNYAVEIYYANGQMMTIDFYSANIFRIFQDNNGGVIRNPKAEPEAEILVKDARRGANVNLTETDRFITIDTECAFKVRGQYPAIAIEVKIDRKTALMTVTNKRTGKVAFQTVASLQLPPLGGGWEGAVGATLTLACNPGEYFYGGGVQNGRFSHRGTSIAIENTNNWVDGGV